MLPSVSPTVLTGRVAPLGPKGHTSGIAKAAAAPPWQITHTGITGDAQADLAHHGGPEKALHHYAFEHYAGYWRNEIGPHPLLDAPGAFGENLSTLGWTEDTVHVGDIVAFGSARLQVSQGRQPCWKLNVRFGLDRIAFRTQASGRTGWYYRVLETGTADAGSRLVLLERPQPEWPLSRLSRLLYRDRDRYDELQAMADLPELASGWRKLARRRIETRQTESWTERLDGPA